MNHIIQLPAAAPQKPSTPNLDPSDPSIRTDAVYVVFTSIDETLAAVRVAHDFASAMDVPLTLIHIRTVPYPLAVDAPSGVSPVETDAFAERLRAEGIDIRVHVYACRNEREAVPLAFTPHSMIVIAGHRRWWPKSSQRWRRTLEAAGHFVVFVDKEKSHA